MTSTSDPDLAAAPSLLMVATVSNTIRHFLLPYAMHFRALGWRVDVAANGVTADPAVRQAFDHVHELPLSRSILDVGGMMRAERELSAILESAPDIVHAHTPIAGFVTRVAARRLPAATRPAVVYTAHGFHFHRGGNPLTNAVFLTAERAAGRWTDRLVVINDEDEAAAARARIVPRRRLVRMPGIGVDTERYARSAIDPGAMAAVRTDAGVAAGDPLFAVVAEHAPRKRVGDVITALASMRHRGAHLMLAGDGPERGRLEGLAEELGVASRVHFLGAVADVRPLVASSTALVLVSDREGLARSVMEALALGVPAIVSTARGNAELVGTDSGIIVPVGEAHVLAAAMDRLIDNPDEGSSMGARGRARMVERYDIAALIAAHETLYRELAEDRSARRLRSGRP